MQPASDPPEFSYLVNLSGVSPEELAVKIQDGRVSVYGEHVERFRDAKGAVNLSLRGFSNEINLPSGIGTDALTFSICNDRILKIQTKKPCPSAVPAAKNPHTSEDVTYTLQPISCPCPPPAARQLPRKPGCHVPECPNWKRDAGQLARTNTAPSSRCAGAAASRG